MEKFICKAKEGESITFKVMGHDIIGCDDDLGDAVLELPSDIDDCKKKVFTLTISKRGKLYVEVRKVVS